VELFRRRPGRIQRLEDELGGRPVEHALEEVGDELPLGLILCIRGLVDVRSRRLVAMDEALLGHDLKELENRRVAGVAAHLFGDLPNRAWAAGPEDAENRELGVSWLAARGLHRRHHLRYPS